MGNSNFVVSSLLGLIVTFLVFTVLSHAADVVSTVCPKTPNPAFCASVLKSAGSTDLKALTTFTLNLAKTNAAKSRAQAKSLAMTSTNPQLKARYLSCSENYDEAIGDIELARNDLVVGDFNGVNIATSGVMTEIDDCEENFKQPPADTSTLLKNGKILNDICSIILGVSNLIP